MSIVTINILMIFVLPKFVDFFKTSVQLPLSTRMLMSVGNFSRNSGSFSLW
jgi:type II secretory pathway component PulF